MLMLKYPALFVRFCLLVCAGLLANLAWAANPIATSNAFDALLSLPQTQPVEGEWNHVAPEGFKDEDEATLIRWLAKQKQAGADFNQIRHQGTMLHHAIRGGLNATALWLLSHGADPLKTLENGEQDQPDALDLSITYRRWPVTDALLKLPGITAPDRAPQLMLAWQAAQGENELTVVDQLFARRLPLPTGAAAERLLGFSLEHQWLKVSLALLKNGVTHAASSAYGWDSANKMGTASDIESADARLAEPILPYLLAHASSVRDVEWSATTRKPSSRCGLNSKRLCRS